MEDSCDLESFDESQIDDVTTDINESLVSAVRQRRILYDPRSNSNKNKNAKEAAWMEIGKELNQSALWCQTEWKKLKAAYGRKKKAIKGKSGQARHRIELWPHFLSMQFLDDFVLEGSTSGNMNDSSQALNSVQPDIASSSEKIQNGNEIAELPVPPIPLEHPKKQVPVNRKRPIADKVDEEIIKFLKKPEEEIDSHHHFCLGLAGQLRKMTDRQSSMAKMKISKVMFEVEYEMCDDVK